MSLENSSIITSKPIIKWAGGKNKIIEKFKPLYERAKPKRYIDLFSGSLSLPLLIDSMNLSTKKSIFNDINKWLINVYKHCKDKPIELIEKLEEYNKKSKNNKECFNEIRDKFNNWKLKKLSSRKKLEMAAIFIYLNKRSFNGLYRENQEGKYNVPYREYKTDIYSKEEILLFSKYLNKTKIKFKSKSYDKFDISKFRKGDLVYIDPPYYPSTKSSFTAYWKTPFLVEQQKELSEFCKKLDEKGIKFIMSNSPCDGIRELYKNFKMESFYIGRQMRSGKGKSEVFDKTDEANEILVWNF